MRIKNVLLSLGILSLTAISLMWLGKVVPKIQFRNADRFIESAINMDNLTDRELKLGDSKSGYIEVPKYCVRSESGYYTSEQSGMDCSEVDKRLCSSSAEKCYHCTYCPPGGYSTRGTMTVTAPSGTWKMTPGDNALKLQYSVSCSVWPNGTCTINGYRGPFVLTAPGSTKTYQYSASVDDPGFGTVNGPTLTIETCSQDWTKGTKTRFFYKINTQEEAVKGSLDVWMDESGCTPEVCADKWCNIVSLYRCRAGAWFSRCGANPGVDVCEYDDSTIGGGLKYADWYNWTKEVDDGAKVAAVSKDKCYGCYGNRTTLAKSTSVVWATGKDYPGSLYKLDEQDSRDKCVAIPEPRVCKPYDHDGEPKTKLETEKCEEEKYSFYGDGKWCGSSGITAGGDDGDVGGESVYSSDAKSFFESKCVARIGNKFDVEGEDIAVNNTLDIKQGQSVGYEIKSTSIKLCYTKFNTGTWSEAYNLVQRKLTTEESRRAGEDIERAREWYKTVLKAILEQINEYMEWFPKHKNEPETTIKLVNGSNAVQPINNPKGEKSKIEVEFVEKPCYNGEEGMDDPNDRNICIPRCKFDESDPEVCVPKFTKCPTDTGCASSFENYRYEIEHDEEGKKLANIEDYGVKYNPSDRQPYITLLALNIMNGAYVREVWSNPVDLSTVKNFLWYTTMKDVLTLIPEEVTYLNRLNGSIVGGGSVPTASKLAPGYNRIYTDEEIKKGQKFTFNVLMDKIGTSLSTVLNNKCELNVLNRDITYRIIEESNPFISETRKKGYNWYRTGQDGILYDFTKTIQTSGGYSRTYEFDRNTINAIKSSNSSYNDAYLGACYYKEDNTPAICSNGS